MCPIAYKRWLIILEVFLKITIYMHKYINVHVYMNSTAVNYYYLKNNNNNKDT